MAVIHRALITWVQISLFLVVLIVKLDGRSDWNWFVVFTPMWLFDLQLFTFLMVKIFQNSRRRNGPIESVVAVARKRAAYVFCVVMKVAFQSLLCTKLQYYQDISYFIIMLPFWGLMVTINCALLYTLLYPHRDNSYHAN